MKSFPILTIQPNPLKFTEPTAQLNFKDLFPYITKLFESIMILPHGCYPQRMIRCHAVEKEHSIFFGCLQIGSQSLVIPPLSVVVAPLS